MKNRLATLGFVVLTALGLSAQNTALEFDGIDDFAFVRVEQALTYLNPDSYTFEVIFKSAASGQSMVILSVPQAGGRLLFGIEEHGSPFLQYRENVYTTEEPQNLLDNQCHHVAVTVLDMMVKFYVDGDFVGYSNLNDLPLFTNQENFYLGMDYPNQSTAFMGVIDEMRLWGDARDDGAIQQWAFAPLQPSQAPWYLLLNFSEQLGTFTFDPHALINYAFWQNAIGANMTWVAPCHSPSLFPERVGWGPNPICTQGNLNNLICNGDFEQYHPALTTPGINIPSNPNYAAPTEPWIEDNLNVNDITNWERQPGSPDFYVRNGVGNIPTVWTAPPAKPNTWDWPTNMNNTAMSGVMTWFIGAGAGLVERPEKIYTHLTTSLIAGVTYRFEGYFHSENLYSDTLFTAPYVQIELSSSTNSNTQVLNMIPLTNNKHLTSQGGWQYRQLTFTANTNGLDRLTLYTRPRYIGPPIEDRYYTYLDDLKLEPYCDGSNFPIGIPLDTSHNQRMDRFMGMDSIGNIYMAGNSYLQPLLHGYFLNKYGPCGDLIWSKPVSYRTRKILAAMTIAPDGKVFLGEFTESANSSKIRVLDANGNFLHLSTLTFGSTINDMIYNSVTQKIIFTYGQNIVRDVDLSFSYGIPYGKTNFTEIDVVECDASGNLYMAGWKDGATPKLVVSKGGGASPYNVVNSANIYTYQNGSDLPAYHHRMVQDIAIDGLGNVWLAGAYASEIIAGTDTLKAYSNNYPNNGYLVKYNSALTDVLVAKALNNTITHSQNTSYLSSIEVDANNNILAAGCFDTMYVDGTMYHSGSSPGLETFVLSLDDAGNYRWLEHTKNSGANGWPYTNENQVVIERQDLTGDYMVAGNFYQSSTEVFEHGTLNSNKLNNAFLCRLKDEGNDAFFKTGNQHDITNPEKAALPKLYPNPAGDLLTIANPTNQLPSVTLYNAQGQQVLQGELNPGANTFGVAHLPAGLYFATIKMEEEIYTIKVIIE